MNKIQEKEWKDNVQDIENKNPSISYQVHLFNPGKYT